MVHRSENDILNVLHDQNLFHPAKNAVAVTPSDVADLSPSGILYIGGAGNVTVDTVGGQTGILFSGLLAGSILDVAIKRVYATGTTATGIVALY